MTTEIKESIALTLSDMKSTNEGIKKAVDEICLMLDKKIGDALVEACEFKDMLDAVGLEIRSKE